MAEFVHPFKGSMFPLYFSYLDSTLTILYSAFLKESYVKTGDLVLYFYIVIEYVQAHKLSSS